MNKIKKIKNKFKKMFFGTFTRGFVSFYATFTLLGAVMLRLPISLQPGVELSFIDAIFISASGISTTGLSTVTISETLSVFGIFVLAFILQFGGIGLMMLVAGFWVIIGKKITFKQRTMIMTDQNQIKMSGVVKLVRNIILIILMIELFGFLALGTYFWLTGYYSFSESFLQSFFLSISMTTNAGFDITGNTSLAVYKNDYYIQLVAMFLMFSGAVGFWPLVEFKEWISAKFKREKYKFSIYTKIIFKMHVGLLIFGAVAMFILEYNNFLQGKNPLESFFYCVFMSLTTRNAGFATMKVADLSRTTIMLFNGLMFIGSSPNSAGGGIRTTTFVLVIAAIHSFAIGREQIVIYKRAIKKETVYRSLLVLIMAIFIVFGATLLMTYTEPFSVNKILFEVSSAFGTTGLSLGITGDLSIVGKIILIATMFIGRIGILTLLLIFKENDSKQNKVKYPELDLIVG